VNHERCRPGHRGSLGVRLGHAVGRAVAVITITVLLSVVAHGVTAEPLAARYAKSLAHPPDGSGGDQMRDIPDRRLIRGAGNRG
jgi:sodium/hydrogen antiporter